MRKYVGGDYDVDDYIGMLKLLAAKDERYVNDCKFLIDAALKSPELCGGDEFVMMSLWRRIWHISFPAPRPHAARSLSS